MKTEIEQFVNDRKLITKRVKKWIGIYTKTEISQLLEISRPTLDTRLQINNWKMKEITRVLEKFQF